MYICEIVSLPPPPPPPPTQDLESSPPSISFARNGNHLGIAFTLEEDKVKGQCFFPHISVKNVMVRMNFCEVRVTQRLALAEFFYY